MSSQLKDASRIFVQESAGVGDYVDAEVIKVVASDKGVERILDFSTNTTSGTIAQKSIEATSTTLPPEAFQQLVESVDYAKSTKPFISEFELSLSLTGGFKMRIKREPSKVVKTKMGH